MQNLSLILCGNAQYQNKEKILHHGTFLFKANLYNLTNSLKSRDIKFKGKAVQSVRSRVGFIGDMIDMDVETFMDKAIEYIKNEYKITGTTFLTEEEMKKFTKLEILFLQQQSGIMETAL